MYTYSRTWYKLKWVCIDMKIQTVKDEMAEKPMPRTVINENS